MKILITGATGFIGSHLARSLFAHHDLVLLTRPESSLDRIDDFKDKVTLLPYSSFSDIENYFQKNHIDGVIHIATKYVKKDEDLDLAGIEDMNQSNITFPTLLLQLLTKQKNKGFFINTGTCFEYKLQNKVLDESSLREGYNYYASTKIAFEELLKYYTQKKNIKAVTLKLFYPYGPADNPKVIPLIMDSFINQKPVALSKGEQTLDFTYVGDIVESFEKALEFIATNYSQYEVFNIGTGNACNLKKINEAFENITGKKSLITFDNPYPPNEIMYMNCNNEKARKILGWEPKTSIEEGVRRTYEYYITNS